MPGITHQDIAERVQMLDAEYAASHAKAYARRSVEMQSLGELCGGLGHHFDKNVWERHFDDAGDLGRTVRYCSFCQARKPEKATV